MTLKEIYKIIDDSDFFLIIDKGEKRIFHLVDQIFKNSSKRCVLGDIAIGREYIFYKFNEETGEMTLLAKVDHIDEEKKIIKKKLGDMSDEEIENFKKKECKKHYECSNCPLYNGETDSDYSPCHCSFIYARYYYLKNKDTELEIEVEE